jgi:hypothetical protein
MHPFPVSLATTWTCGPSPSLSPAHPRRAGRCPMCPRMTSSRAQLTPPSCAASLSPNSWVCCVPACVVFFALTIMRETDHADIHIPHSTERGCGQGSGRRNSRGMYIVSSLACHTAPHVGVLTNPVPAGGAPRPPRAADPRAPHAHGRLCLCRGLPCPCPGHRDVPARRHPDPGMSMSCMASGHWALGIGDSCHVTPRHLGGSRCMPQAMYDPSPAGAAPSPSPSPSPSHPRDDLGTSGPVPAAVSTCGWSGHCGWLSSVQAIYRRRLRQMSARRLPGVPPPNRRVRPR